MGIYGRKLMKTDRRYRLRVAEGALEAIDDLLDQIESSTPPWDVVHKICSAIGAWREGLVLEPGDLKLEAAINGLVQKVSP